MHMQTIHLYKTHYSRFVHVQSFSTQYRTKYFITRIKFTH